MIRKIGLFTLLLPLFLGFSLVAQQTQKIVAWDIHSVLCTQPARGKAGWQCQIKPESLKLVQELDAQGVKQVIFSNITAKEFRILVGRYPQLFNYFDLSRSLACASGIFNRKPHSKYVKKFICRAQKPASGIIFFDDKARNIQGARKCGICAYQFTGVTQARIVLKQNKLL